MVYLPAVLGTPLRARVLERLLRRGPAAISQLATDLDASRQNVSRAVDELALLQILREAPGKDKRATIVSVNEEHPFIEPLRVLAVDGATWFETPEAWQRLIARRHGRDWYIGGYAAIRRVMQPTDLEAPNVLVNILGKEEKPQLASVLERAAGIELRFRHVERIPPEVLPIRRDDIDVWFATPERGFIEAWKTKEIPLYGLFLCLVQGLHDAALDPKKLLAIAPSENAERDARTLLAAARERLHLRELKEPIRATRPLKPAEKEALEQALNTVVG